MQVYNFIRVSCSHLLRNLRCSCTSQILALLTVSLSILVFAFFYLLYSNAMSVGVRLNDEIKIIVYLNLESDPSEAEKARLEEKIRAFGDIDRIVFVSKDDAYHALKTKLGKRQAVLEGLPTDFLPPAVEIYPSRDLRALSTLDTFVRHLYDQPMTLRVQDGQQWVDRFQQIMFVVRTVTLLSIALLVVSIAYTVAYTIRLVLSSRREELQYFSLIGASPMLIQMPFVIEGLFQGFFGGVISTTMLYGLYVWSLQVFSGSSYLSSAAVSFLSPIEIAAIIGSSMFFCSFVSFLSVRRYTRLHSTSAHWTAAKRRSR